MRSFGQASIVFLPACGVVVALPFLLEFSYRRKDGATVGDGFLIMAFMGSAMTLVFVCLNLSKVIQRQRHNENAANDDAPIEHDR
jgi:hypothetical protein